MALVWLALWPPAFSHGHPLRSDLNLAFPEPHFHGDHSYPLPPELGHRSCPSDPQATADGQCLRCKATPSPVPPIDGLRLNGTATPAVPPISEPPRPRPVIHFVPPSCGPPDLAPSWQFLVRAARLARPPSALS